MLTPYECSVTFSNVTLTLLCINTTSLCWLRICCLLFIFHICLNDEAVEGMHSFIQSVEFWAQYTLVSFCQSGITTWTLSVWSISLEFLQVQLLYIVGRCLSALNAVHGALTRIYDIPLVVYAFFYFCLCSFLLEMNRFSVVSVLFLTTKKCCFTGLMLFCILLAGCDISQNPLSGIDTRWIFPDTRNWIGYCEWLVSLLLSWLEIHYMQGTCCSLVCWVISQLIIFGWSGKVKTMTSSKLNKNRRRKE